MRLDDVVSINLPERIATLKDGETVKIQRLYHGEQETDRHEIATGAWVERDLYDFVVVNLRAFTGEIVR